MRYFLILLLSVFFLTGCGDGRPRRVQVSGVIHVDGKLLESPKDGELMGFVRFYPIYGGRPAYAKIENDGSFLLGNYEKDDGCPTGEFKVELYVTKRNGKKMIYLVPPRYADDKTSDITVKIDGKTENLIIDAVWNSDDEKFRNKVFFTEVDDVL